MTKPINLSSAEFHLSSSFAEKEGRPDSHSAFRILVLGDFSARERSAVSTPLSQRKLHAIDRDDFDKVLAVLSPVAKLAGLGPKEEPLTLEFKELDDFHPDRLVERLEIFSAFRATRAALKNPATFAATADKLQKRTSGSETPRSRVPKGEIPESVVLETEANLLDQILAQSQPVESAKDKPRPSSDWDDYLNELVAPYLLPKPDPIQEELLAAVDDAAAEMLRVILHHPVFKIVEAIWRGLHLLVSRSETEETLQIYLLDVNKDELAADLAGDDLSQSGLYRLLSQRREGAALEERGVLVGHYEFAAASADLDLLARLSIIARTVGCPFVGAADESLIGCKQLARTPDPDDWTHRSEALVAAWDDLRQMPSSVYLGLVLPRVLLRLPYGEETDPLESFAFHEMAPAPLHENYLWGNSALVCALLLGQSYSLAGWDMRSNLTRELERLPLHVYKESGETKSKSCSEVYLSERAAEKILELGIMPLISPLHQDSVRLPWFKSLSADPCFLAGLGGDE